MESVQYVRNQGNFGNYNNVQPQWKGQVNNSWNSQPSVLYQRPAQPPGFQHPQQQSDHNQPWSLFKDDINEMKMMMRSLTANVRTMENRVSQMEKQHNERPLGTLPNNTIPNPRGKELEHCKAINLRSGTVLPDIVAPPVEESEKPEDHEDTDIETQSENEEIQEKNSVAVPAQDNSNEVPKVKPPFPIKLKKQRKKELDPAMRKFIQTLENIQINLPLIDLLR